MGIHFRKGHGTHNDFVLLKDPGGMREMTPELVRALADRRGGIGGDGVIRAVRAGLVDGWEGDPDLWFMDYWNADGTVAEMCGNGLRVFAEFLRSEQMLNEREFDVATRAGVKHARFVPGGVAVSVGHAAVGDDTARVTVGGTTFDAVPVNVGNPHAVSFIGDEDLAALDLRTPPVVEPSSLFPDGVNVEFVRVDGPGELAMRVHERGVGETQSCGTGVVAAAAAYRSRFDVDGPVQVTVPGGQLLVEFNADEAVLTGPAVIVASGDFHEH